MELVYQGGREYGGIDVGIGGERYTVIKEGSRQLVRGVPNHLAPLLGPHSWIPTGVATADLVEQAAQEAFRAKAKADVAKKQLAQAEADASDAEAKVEHAKTKLAKESESDKKADKK